MNHPRLFCVFHCRLCTTTTWKCLISRSCWRRERKTTFFFFPKLQYSLLDNSRKICQHWTSWNKRVKVWDRKSSISAIVVAAIATIAGKWFPYDHWTFFFSAIAAIIWKPVLEISYFVGERWIRGTIQAASKKFRGSTQKGKALGRPEG